jgi:hypothetical protein
MALVDREDSISIGRWAARMGREGGWRPRAGSMFVAVVALDRLDNKPPASEVKKMAKQNGDGLDSGA